MAHRVPLLPERRLRRQLVPRLKADARGLDPGGLAWDARYFFGRRHDGWYLSLFPDGRASVPGEITPDYSALDERTVARVHRLLPEVKLIFLMRDPIERSWSQIRMDLAREGRRARDVPIAELIERACSARVARRSYYDRTLRSWGSHFAEDRIFVGFVEDVRARPESVLGSLWRFLGVEAGPVDSGLARRRVHAGEDAPLPVALEREIARVHVEGLRSLAGRFGGHAAGWLARAERSLGA